MSLASYRRNVSRRVTSPYLPTCFPAALEQVWPHHGYRPSVYENYKEFIEWYCSMNKARREAHSADYEEMVNMLVRPLGGLSCEDVIFKHVNTPLGFVRVVNKLLNEECSVVADIRVCLGPHAVGIIPTHEPGFVTLVSNQIPEKLQGVIPIQAVAERFLPNNDKPMTDYPFNNANILALPPAV